MAPFAFYLGSGRTHGLIWESIKSGLFLCGTQGGVMKEGDLERRHGCLEPFTLHSSVPIVHANLPPPYSRNLASISLPGQLDCDLADPSKGPRRMYLTP